jgi:hypothetical protein
MATKKRNFADVFKRYRTYDPKTEGYGSVKDWSAAFNERMGLNEARATLNANNPLAILGLTVLPDTLEALKKVYRALIRVHHPDAGGDPEMAKKIIAAYSVLEDRIHRRDGK